MDFLNKAKEAAEKYAGGGDKSEKKSNKAHIDDGSILTKALDAVDKYHVKEKAVEFAQKQVAKREEEKRRPGYVEKKEKSIVEKAKEAAEDFLAKQGDKIGETKTKDKTKDKTGEQRHEQRSPSSSQANIYKNDPIPSAPGFEEPSFYPPRDNETGYSGTNNGGFNDSFNRMNLGSNESQVSGGSRYETYREYWSRQDKNAGGPGQYPNYANTDANYGDARCVPGYAGASTATNQSTQYGTLGGATGSQYNVSESSRYEEYPHRKSSLSNWSGVAPAGSEYDRTSDRNSGYYETQIPDNASRAGMQYANYPRYTSTEHV